MDWLRGAFSQAAAAFRAMTAAQRASMVMLGLTIAVALGLVAFLGARPKYVPVAGNLDQAMMRVATGILDAQGVEYKVDGQRILVAQDRQPSVAAMFRKSEVIAKENIFDRNTYRSTVGSSLFISQKELEKHRRDALGGELRRMISELEGVETCRVVITDADEGEFELKPEKAGVSVTVTPRAGKKIDQAFANSIIDLVSSAVSKCDPARITVIDTRNPGRQFHKEDSDTEVAIGNKKIALSREIEQLFQKKLNDFIASTGYQGTATVTCKELDLRKVEEMIQKVNPNEIVTVYQKTIKRESSGGLGTGGPTGVPMNAPDNAVVPAGVSNAAAGTAAGSVPRSKESESETRTQFSFETQKILSSPVKVAKLAAGVVVNRRVLDKVDKDGKVYQVYDEEPSDQVKGEWKNLIAKILGIDKAEDIDSSITLAFWKQPRDAPDVVPPAPQPDLKDVVASYWPYARIGGVLMLTAFAFLFLFVLGRRAATAPLPDVVVQPPRAGGAAPGEEEGEIEADDVKLRHLQDKLRGLVGQDPRKVATLVRRWLTHEG